ncbi:nucleoside-diphosphate-sugar epimerase [Paenibacillus shirakamiensis]|uniref:Nucleoside-diphosphate-sugar epimerase n=1 Tax=Paenibacillus shirakamiensis TaxID=1265935 RepID=A0ABS4JEF2_9BACL|nr:NAD-dependent epimerase/dehydratase family protein [Paenibacillus shirakamiensis]MBP2000089.1 nucleoside-diphosphate-sugar epimerase [Paenibacillus shirakamiensis]
MNNVFVLGGTGFLGYFTVKELIKRGYEVSTISRHEMPTENLLPSEVKHRVGNIHEMSDEDIRGMLEGVDGFIYAAGVDERTLPEAPAMKFFYEANVLPTQRIARLATQAGVKKFVILGSYFAHFAEAWTDIPLKENAYPRSRLLQEEVAYMEGIGKMDVMSIRLPYIFGVMPGRMPLWTRFIERVRDQASVPVLGGGTAMVTAQQVAEAAVGAMEHGEHGGKYAICGLNMKHSEFYEMVADALGQKDTTVKVVPLEQMQPAMEIMDRQKAKAGKEQGVHMSMMAEILHRDAYLSPADTMSILKYKEDDVRASIKETLHRCIQSLDKQSYN